MEDIFSWKTTFDGKQPSMEEDLLWIFVNFKNEKLSQPAKKGKLVENRNIENDGRQKTMLLN